MWRFCCLVQSMTSDPQRNITVLIRDHRLFLLYTSITTAFFLIVYEVIRTRLDKIDRAVYNTSGSDLLVIHSGQEQNNSRSVNAKATKSPGTRRPTTCTQNAGPCTQLASAYTSPDALWGNVQQVNELIALCVKNAFDSADHFLPIPHQTEFNTSKFAHISST